jgi:tRNA1Val (adenine37-N6)-methyltransferase
VRQFSSIGETSVCRRETLDTLCKGRLSILQRKDGYRFSLDAPLLAHFVAPRSGERIADLGTGNGVIGLVLATLHKRVRVVGIEVQAAMAERADRNAALNRLQDRATVIHGDVRLIRDLCPLASFDVVVCNPPYRVLKSGRLNPDDERRIARHEVKGSLRDFLRAASYLLRQKGRSAWVFPATRAIDLLLAMRQEGIEPKRLRLVHSFEGGPATLVLAEGVRGGKCELEVMAPLVIYGADRRYTPEARAMLAE